MAGIAVEDVFVLGVVDDVVDVAAAVDDVVVAGAAVAAGSGTATYEATTP